MTWLLTAVVVAAPPCTLRGERWVGEADLETDAGVRLGALGPTGPVVLSQRSGRWSARVDTTDLSLDVFTRAAVSVEVARPIRVTGQLSLDPGFELTLEPHAAAAQVRWPDFLGDAGVPVTDVACRHLRPAVDRPSVCMVVGDGCRDALPTESEPMEWASEAKLVGVVFPGGKDRRPLVVRATPGGASGLVLAPMAPWPVRLLARQGVWRQLSLRREGVVVTGWVHEDDVVVVEPWRTGVGALGLAGRRVGCRKAARLFAVSEAGVEPIGSLKPGATARERGERGDLVLLDGVSLDLPPDGGVTLAVRRDEAGGCFGAP